MVLEACHAMPSYVYGCGPCCEFRSQHSSLLGRMAEAMGHALQKFACLTRLHL